MMKKVIITGASGMLGKAVLQECLEHSEIVKVLIINRKSIGVSHDKLEELILKDFSGIELEREHLKGYDACFYCMGVSAVGMNEETYVNITYNITKMFADVLFDINPNIVFNYISGAGTDTSESGKVMWARVKGKTENYILNKGFKKALMFRPGLIIPEKGTKSRTGWLNTTYTIMSPLFPLLKKSSSITTSTNIGLAMINSLLVDANSKYLSNKEINLLAKKEVV
ncbi:NAD-dependent epimerase/dehydratase family protein [Aestuariibaculum sp. M13]|uniref:NAD-dependent epimerase/dehydratase family protein n=1 Tax=Aestuariibaculum sp. M13 TaxID=2967132 RepID=UPI002159FBF6|nr:NAD-dependent epimerase/dehydratase family protein [Aestuariibaculum sp. M13]MCR8667428.1 NAD-dependent epimerase/dehydratase family protein [Aestuariibaculum sp. M13]